VLDGSGIPEAKVEVRGNLEALLQLTGEVESVGSPGGILAPLIFQSPPRTTRLHVFRRGRDSIAGQQWRAAGGR